VEVGLAWDTTCATQTGPYPMGAGVTEALTSYKLASKEAPADSATPAEPASGEKTP